MKRNRFFDIYKGLAIICIVLGHSCGNTKIIAFLYLFHLPAFFFITGYMTGGRWAGNTEGYIGSRIIPVWIKYMIYGLVFVLMHNFLVINGAVEGELYNHTAMLENYLSHAVFTADEKMAGAMWYMPVWLFAACIFGALLTKTEDIRIVTACSIFAAVLGVVLYKRNVWLSWHIQTSFIAVGFMFMGWFLSRFGDIRGYVQKPGTAACCAAVILFMNRRMGLLMDLSSGYIPGPVIFISGALGSLMLLCLSRYAEKLSVFEKPLAFLGRQSFDIMALHFTVFKLVDIVYSGQDAALREALKAFPVSFPGALWPVYIILGLFIPAFIGLCIDRLKGAAAGFLFNRRRNV